MVDRAFILHLLSNFWDIQAWQECDGVNEMTTWDKFIKGLILQVLPKYYLVPFEIICQTCSEEVALLLLLQARTAEIAMKRGVR